MSLLSLRVPDDVEQVYMDHSGRSYKKAIESNIERFKNVKPDDRVLLFSSEERRELESVVGKMLSTPEEVIERLRGALAVTLNDASVTLTEVQLRRVAAQAKFYKRTSTEHLTQLLQEALKGLI